MCSVSPIANGKRTLGYCRECTLKKTVSSAEMSMKGSKGWVLLTALPNDCEAKVKLTVVYFVSERNGNKGLTEGRC